MLSVLIFAYIVLASENIVPLPVIVLVAGLGLLWCGRVIRTGRIGRLDLIILVNYAYWLWSAFLLAALPAQNFLNFQFWRWDGRGFFYYVPFLFFFGLRLKPCRVVKYLYWQLTVTAVIALASIVQFFTGVAYPFGLHMALTENTDAGVVRSLFGLSQTHNAAGLYFGVVATGWLALLIAGTSLPTRWHRRLAFVSLGVIAIAFVLTTSREGLVGFLVAMLYLLGRRLQRRTIKRAAIGALGVAVLLLTLFNVSPDFAARIRVTNFEDYNVSNRFLVWQISTRLFTESPVLGIGFSRWNDIWDLPNPDARLQGIPGLIRVARDVEPVYSDDSPHNSYLLKASETGVIGLALLAALWIGLLRLLRTRGTARRRAESSLAEAATAVIILLLGAAFFGDELAAPAAGLPAALWIGLTVAVLSERGAPQLPELPQREAAPPLPPEGLATF